MMMMNKSTFLPQEFPSRVLLASTTGKLGRRIVPSANPATSSSFEVTESDFTVFFDDNYRPAG